MREASVTMPPSLPFARDASAEPFSASNGINPPEADLTQRRGEP
jgi:hypothetical protein